MSLQSCLTLCNPRDGSPPVSPIPGILQARTLECVAISFSNASKWKVKVKSLSHVWLLVTPWTAAYQAPPSMRFSRREYWSGMPLPSPLESLEKVNKLCLSSQTSLIVIYRVAILFSRASQEGLMALLAILFSTESKRKSKTAKRTRGREKKYREFCCCC